MDTNMLVSRQVDNAGLVTLMETKERQRRKANAARLVEKREQNVEVDTETVFTWSKVTEDFCHQSKT